MTSSNIRRSANNLTFCLININSLKGGSADDRTSELFKLFNDCKAQLYIITETKLTEEAAAKFNPNYVGKLWKHSVTTDNDAGAGISIAYDPLMGKCELIPLPSEIQNRAIAIRFLPPNADHFIVMGVYAPASGTVAIKRNFINQIFQARSSLQQLFNCNIIIGGDFNSTIGHLENNMRDFRNSSFNKPNSIAKLISSRMTECGYVHPFEPIVKKYPGREYLTFQCTTNTQTLATSAKGIDHFLFPSALLNQLEDLRISNDFFAGSKHKTVTILIRNLMTLPISANQNIKHFVPSIVWNNPDFSNCSKNIYTKYITDHKDLANSNWDTLMAEIKMLAIRKKKTILRALLLENEIHPTPETKAKIAQFIPSSTRPQHQWARSVSNTIPFLKGVNGVTSSHKEMCSIAASHLSSLFENKDTCSEAEVMAYLSSLNLPQFTPDEKNLLMKPFTLEEVENIVSSMPSGKSSGKDNIPIDIFKNSTELCSILLACANNTFQGNQPLPDSLCSVLFRLIPKDPDLDPTNLDNYRPIGLLPMAYRIMSKAITNRLQPMLSRLIGPHQYAYVNGRRSENIARILSEMMFQTITVPNSSILNLKLDFRKAFDSMSFQYVRCFLKAIDTPNLLVIFIMHLLTNLNGAVIINNGFSDTFAIARGTTQGSALSAILFVLCLEGLCFAAISDPIRYGAAQIPQLNLLLTLLAFADDVNIFTTLHCISEWFKLLSYWGSISGVIINIPKSLLNFWSNTDDVLIIPALEDLLLNHSCPAYKAAGIFHPVTNMGGWRISLNGDFSLLGLHYSFKFQHSEVDYLNENFNVSTNLFISFTSNTWNLTNETLPDPRAKLASALYALSDNIFDRLVNLKSRFVSGLIYRFYNCPCSYKVLSTNQNQANVVVLSPSATHSPCIKLNTLFQEFSQGGCQHVSLSSIQNAISVHTIILLLSGLCDKWVFSTYRRDLLRIVYANCLLNETMRRIPFEIFSRAGLHYLFGLPLICSRVIQSGLPMLWTTYASISNFISIPKQTTSNLIKGTNTPNLQELTFFNQLLNEPLWLNKLFLNPTTSASIAPTCEVVDLFCFRHIWCISLCSISITNHETTCSAACTHDHNCRLFWASCIPLHIVEFAAWCSPHFVPIQAPLDYETQCESTVFTLEIQSNSTHAPILLPACSVKLLTAYYTSVRAGPPNLSLISGVCGWMTHWPHLAGLFNWKAYFKLLEHEEISKPIRTAYWRLLHRCHVPRAKNSLTNTPYLNCKYCAQLNVPALFNPEHAIFGCPKVQQFWLRIIAYIQRINSLFDNNLSFITIISLGLHNMTRQDRTNNIVTATHNIIGLGIQTLTTFPIDSSDSLQTSLISFRQRFRQFIRNVTESKINAHLSRHGPNQDLYPALRSSLALELSTWTVMRDNNSMSPHIPTWSDYTYADPV